MVDATAVSADRFLPKEFTLSSQTFMKTKNLKLTVCVVAEASL
jgi:hypothetical protein